MRSSRVKRRYRPEKPAIDDRPNDFLFAPGPAMRRMRVLLDVDSFAAEGFDEAYPYLAGLLNEESILAWRFSDQGPPKDAEVIEISNVRAAAGWIAVDDGRDRVIYARDESIATSVLHVGDLAHLVRGDTHDPSHIGLGEDEAAARRLGAFRLLKVAHAADVDLLITERPYLRNDPYGFVSGGITEVVSATEAPAIVGLYLRTQRRFVVDVSPRGARFNFNKGLMTWVASRSLLPEGWRWMSACVQHSTHTGEDLLTHYAGTVHHRLERTLTARDNLYVALNQPQNNDTADEAMAALDNILINLSACLDVTARVYNHVLGAPSPVHQVGWRRGQWLDKVRKLDPGVKVLLDNPDFENLIVIVAELRNTIHGAALDPIAIVQGFGSQRDDTRVGLPADRLKELLAAMDALGGRSSWGVRELAPGRAHAEVDVLCERLMGTVPAMLNVIMKMTPVESLEGVSLSDGDLSPEAGPQDPFNERFRRNILQQYGLPVP